jgi:threonine dehydratase
LVEVNGIESTEARGMTATTELVTPDRIAATDRRIREHLRRTPLLGMDLPRIGHPPQPVELKCEYMQVAGSFKARGAFANLVLRDVPEAGVVAASGGNHGVAVAYAAQRLGVPASIFVPTISAPEKIARIRSLGAELVVAGDRYADALDGALEHQARGGAMAVHAFDQPETLLGQGTVGLELREQRPDLDTVLVPVGGGGLVAGVAASYAGGARIVAVEPAGAPTLTYARRAGEPVDAPTGSVAADALAPRRIGQHPFAVTERFVEQVVLVDDDAIIAAQRMLWGAARLLVEPAAATAAAAITSGAYRPAPNERVAVLVTGANLDPTTALPE